MDKKDYIIGILALCIILGLFFFWVVPGYRQEITEQVVSDVALQQTQTGRIFIVINNTVQTYSIQDICGGQG